MSSRDWFLFIITSTWPIIIIVLIILFSKIKKIREHKKEPIQAIIATLISKQMVPILTGGHLSSKVNVHYYLKFELGNGEKKEFEVLPNQYAIILGGNIGKLTFKGNKFLSFYITKIN